MKKTGATILTWICIVICSFSAVYLFGRDNLPSEGILIGVLFFAISIAVILTIFLNKLYN